MCKYFLWNTTQHTWTSCIHVDSAGKFSDELVYILYLIEDSGEKSPGKKITIY